MNIFKIPYFLILFILVSCQAPVPQTLGPQGENHDSFFPCPKSPNCFSSTEKSSSEHYSDPIKHNMPLEQAKKSILMEIPNLTGCKIKKKENNYIWAECYSSLFKFTDDLEIIFIDGIIHIKSASRSGYFDFGVNKKRISELTFKFHQSGHSGR